MNIYPKKLSKKVDLLNQNLFEIKIEKIFDKSDDKIVFFENIRFYEQEEKNDEEFKNVI